MGQGAAQSFKAGATTNHQREVDDVNNRDCLQEPGGAGRPCAPLKGFDF